MYDVIIIGAGPAGLAAGMYAGRLNLRTLIIGEDVGGLIATTQLVENYPGFKRISGEELSERLLEHAEEYGVELVEARVIDVEKTADGFRVLTDEDESYSAKALIFATGTRHRRLPAKGAEQYENRGIYYCALCDGPLFKNKVVAVVGGSDSAAKEALLLAEYARKVYIIYRGEKLRGEPPNLRRIEENEKIEVIYRTNIVEVKGDRLLRSIVLDREYNGSKELSLDGVFVAIGGEPQSELAKKLGVETNEKGEIIIDRDSRTSVAGVFAAGDVVASSFKQAIVGVAEGVVAAYSAYRFVTSGYVATRASGE
jgi:thioredoxin reductase (NADPH)